MTGNPIFEEDLITTV